MTSQERASINQVETSDKLNESTAPSPVPIRGPTLKMLGLKSATSRDLYSKNDGATVQPYNRLHALASNLQNGKKLQIQKLPEESQSILSVPEEPLKFFQIGHVMEVNGLIQMSLFIFMVKYGLMITSNISPMVAALNSFLLL